MLVKTSEMWRTFHNRDGFPIVDLFPNVEKFPKRESPFNQNHHTLKANEKFILFGGLAIAAVVLFAKTRALANLVFSPGSISNMGFSNSVPVADVTIIAQNTSTASLTINSFAGNVYSNNTLVGNIFNFTPVTIPGNAATPINISIQFQALGIVTDLVKAFSTNNFQQIITVQGYANVSGLQLPVNLNFSVGASS